jgi:hypothetical protein
LEHIRQAVIPGCGYQVTIALQGRKWHTSLESIKDGMTNGYQVAITLQYW